MLSFSYQEVLENSTKYFNGNELSAKVFADKYALQDKNGYLELTPDDMHRRLAREFARIEAKKFKRPLTEAEIYGYFKNFSKIIPQGSPMYGIGNPQYISLSNCFVLEPPVDSYGGILHTDQQLVHVSKRRGGCGIDLDHLRPTDAPTHNSSKTSSGMASWMRRYSNSIREVGQNGRRGALMLTLSVHHPDILTFATIKNDNKSITGANISVKLTNEFLNAVTNDTLYEQRWPVDSKNPIIKKMVPAREIWNTIIHSAWLRAEPGLLFWDNILTESIADCYPNFRTICTNPCGEVPLSVLDSCRLLVLNLMAFVTNPFTCHAKFDFEAFYEMAQIAQRLMDDLVDLEIEAVQRIIDKIESDPESDYIKRTELDLWYKIKSCAIDGRRTGTGITALGDCLAALGIKYGSKRSIEVTEKIYQTLKFACYESSNDMADEIGAFPAWDSKLEKDNPFLDRFSKEELKLTDDHIKFGSGIVSNIRRTGRRNIALLTSAPTGTTSMVAGYEVNGKWYYNTTSGIEPCIAESYTRRKKGNLKDEDFRVDFTDQNGDTWMEFDVNHEGLQAWMDLDDTRVKESSPYNKACAEDIDWVNRVKLQAAAQKHIDHSISSTINLPADVSESKVAEIYETAWKAGCKGVTVYRDGCRSGVLIKKTKGIPKHDAPVRPKEIECDVYHISVQSKPYFVLVGLYEGDPYEVFAGKNGFISKSVKKGKIIRVRKNFYKAVLDDDTEISPITLGCTEHEESLTRMTSTALRHGAEVKHVVEQLNKIEGDMTSYARSIGRALKKYIADGSQSDEACPECNNTLIFQEGCLKCCNCGYSKCS